MLNPKYRDSYTTSPRIKGSPKLLDTDMVEMSDGTFKTGLELQIGDIIKTIDIPNPNGVDNASYLANFEITYETLVSGTTYSTNRVTNKKRVNLLAMINQLTFDDNSTWEDTDSSSYLIERDNVIQFEQLFNIKMGDVVLLLDTTESLVDFVRKNVVENIQIRRIFSGWFITVENEHLFLTKTTSTNNETFVSIEHNEFCPSCTGAGPSGYCPKSAPKCSSNYTCTNANTDCP